MQILISLAYVIVSTLIIMKACDGFETAADYLGRNLSEGVKGASINAVGSSMPELFTTFVFIFLFNDTTGFAGGIATTAGSSVFNSLIIPAASIIAATRIFKIAFIKASKKVILRDGLMLIAAQFILIVTIGKTLQWWHGMMLMLLYVGYASYMFTSMKSNGNENPEEEEEKEEEGASNGSRFMALLKLDLETAILAGAHLNTLNAWGLLSIATLFISVACFILVYGCEMIGHALGIHGYFVAVILAAASSSVPDTILSVKDARKGNYDDAVSNALGSNIFDICFALGLPLFLYTLLNGPITMQTEILDDVSELRILLLGLTIIAFIIYYFGKGMGKGKAWTLFGLYGMFTAFIVGKAYENPFAIKISDGLQIIQSYIQ